jgi:hypothetical protein
MLALRIIIFWARKTFSGGISMPKSAKKEAKSGAITVRSDKRKGRNTVRADRFVSARL